MNPVFDRRHLVHATSGLLIASAAGPYPVHAAEADPAMEVTPPEDLMREHGVLNRVLLVYEAGLQKFARGEDFDVAILARAAGIVHEFIEDYHERNEEQQLFPRFRKAGQMVELVNVLYQQHQAGRRLTDSILGLVPASQVPGETGAGSLRICKASLPCTARTRRERIRSFFRRCAASSPRTSSMRWRRTSSVTNGASSERTDLRGLSRG